MFHRALFIVMLALSSTIPVLAQEPPPLPEGYVLRGDLLVPEFSTEGVYAGQPWPQGVVDYYLQPSLGPYEREQLAKAMAEIEAVCGAIFRPIPVPSGMHLFIFDGTGNFASLGAQPNCSGTCQLQMSIFNWESKWIIVHELMHVLGFDHEHNHPNRDQFIQVNTDNIMTGEEDNFLISAGGMGYSNPYDFESVLHYGPFAFSWNQQPTIEALPGTGNPQFGQRSYLSFGDALDLRTVYGPGGTPSINRIREMHALGASGNVEVELEGQYFFQGSDDQRGVQGSYVTYAGSLVESEVIDGNFVRVFIEKARLQPGGLLQVHNPFPGGGDSNAIPLNLRAGMESIRITEVAWSGPTGVEIFNESRDESIDISGWTLRIRGAYNGGRWFPPGTVIGPREIILFLDVSQGLPPEMPAGTRVIDWVGLGSLADGTSVSIVTPDFVEIDEVRIETSLADGSEPPEGYGRFEGYAKRSTTGTPKGVERIWGLDSDTGRDWTGETTTSLGRENRNTGIRGRDPRLHFRPRVRITEIDPANRYVELRNVSLPVNMRGYYLLCSAAQNEVPRVIRLFDTGVVENVQYLVLGNGLTAPSEMPAGTLYLPLGPEGAETLNLGDDEFSLALYDRNGALLDLVRTTGHDDLVVHNNPRAPSHWLDFIGAAARTGSGTLGRAPFTNDFDTGADFGMVSSRTMGFQNAPLTDSGGHGDALDVRINGAQDGFGLTLIVTAGPAYAGQTYGLLSAYNQRTYGQGSFFGLHPSAATNWLLQSGSAPWSATLDADGSFRYDLPPGVLPSFVADHRAVVYDPATGQISLYSLVIEEDHAFGLPF